MLESIYIGMTGLSAYSKALNTLSNNVANLNTPGFKGSQLQFADLYYRDLEGAPSGQLPHQMGTGVDTGASTLNFQTGESHDTGNPLDLMIDGPGLFVLRLDGRLLYTRAGQFEFDADGWLVDRTNHARVATLGEDGQLHDITLAGLRVSPAQPTTSVALMGTLSADDTQHTIDAITVYDSAGAARSVKLVFDRVSEAGTNRWKLTATLADGTALGSGELAFGADGKPDADHASLSLDHEPEGGASIKLQLQLSADAMSVAAGSNSTLSVQKQDGHGLGALLSYAFDEEGRFKLSYDNGQTEAHGQLAVSWFNSPDQLQALGGNVYAYRDGATVQYGHPHGQGYGAVKPHSVELSNVDLAKQFGELIITQRGYQASSQVITTANEMIQQLMDLRSRR